MKPSGGLRGKFTDFNILLFFTALFPRNRYDRIQNIERRLRKDILHEAKENNLNLLVHDENKTNVRMNDLCCLYF